MKNTKSIILCTPHTHGISKAIYTALTKEGYIVYDFIIQDATFKYKNIFQRLQNLYRKLAHKDFAYKNQLIKKARVIEIEERLESISPADYALFIRPDLLPKEFVLKIKNKTKKTICYQWDGLNRFPEIFDYIQYFDKFFNFDPKHINLEKGILPITNFFITDENDYKVTKNSIYFLATYDDYRFNQLQRLKKTLQQLDIPENLFFLPRNEDDCKILINNKYPLIEKIDYAQNLLLVQKASILIDLVKPIHNGLSFRIFEALYYDIKLITDNKTVKDYDFYNPNNIFIWEENNEDQILSFLELEYVPVKENIKSKYSFQNWIKYILDDGEYSAIELPSIE